MRVPDHLRRGPHHALVVAADPNRRLELRATYAARGYDVTTCPGDGVACPALRSDGGRCPRVAEGTAVVVISASEARERRLACYRDWEPEAVIEVVDQHGDEEPATAVSKP